MIKKKALITGITGQSGLFLTRELLKDKDYEIVGTSRNKVTKISNLVKNLKKLK